MPSAESIHCGRVCAKTKGGCGFRIENDENPRFQMKELSVEELSRVCGGGDNSFDGLAEGDIYESKDYPGVEYAKIGTVNYGGDGNVYFYKGTKDGNCIRHQLTSGGCEPPNTSSLLPGLPNQLLLNVP